MQIGLIGGIGPAATDFYSRQVIATYASRDAPLELTIVHADTPTLLGNLASNNSSAQTAIYMRLSRRIVAAGAEFVEVTIDCRTLRH
jgi:aspartate racemase